MRSRTRKWIEFFGIVAFLFVIGGGAYSYLNLGVFNNFDNAIRIFDGLGWFVGTFALASLFTAYLVVVADMRFIFRFLAIPAWLAFSFTLLAALDQFMGYSYPATPPQGHLLSYRVIRDTQTGTRHVEAWFYFYDQQRTRAYIFPFDRDQEEAMYRAMRMKARGEMVEVELLKEGENNENRPRPEDMIKHDIRHRGLPQKDYEKHGGEIEEGETAEGISDMGQRSRRDKHQLIIPGGGNIELEPGQIIQISPEGQIEILDPGSIKQEQIKNPAPSSSGPHPSAPGASSGPPGSRTTTTPQGETVIMGTTTNVVP